jgi:hypothetical protein
MKRFLLVLSLAGLAALPRLPSMVEAGIGVVTGVRGEATLRRDPQPQPQAVKFKDDLFWLDTLNTGADSRLRLFILEKSVITMKEHSRLQLREEAASATQPKKKNIANLISGATRAVVEKEALKDTDYEIRTSRAIAGIRGSDIIGAIGGAMNNRLLRAGLPRVPNEDCVAFISGPDSHAGITDAKLGRTDLDQLEYLIACDQFTRIKISESQFDDLGSDFPPDPPHIPEVGGGGPPGGDGPPPGRPPGFFPPDRRPNNNNDFNCNCDNFRPRKR